MGWFANVVGLFGTNIGENKNPAKVRLTFMKMAGAWTEVELNSAVYLREHGYDTRDAQG
jgi:hypothetical protein